jgi:FkbM family methyltransferase
MKKVVKVILKYIGSCISWFLWNPFFFKQYNCLFEHSPRGIIRFFVKYISLPDANNIWKIELLNGKSVLTKIDKCNAKTAQFALSYKWHSPSLNFTEKILNEYYPIDVPSIDVGANMGLRSLLSLSENRHVYFIEPNAEVNKLNIERCKLNNFKNYTLFDVGASDRKGTIEFTIDESSYCSTIEKDTLSEDVAIDHQEIIHIDTLDNLFVNQINTFKTAFIKIDVEGHELKVLAGARSILTVWMPTLIIEVNERGDHLSEFIDILSGYGYQVFEVGEFGKKYFKKVTQGQSDDYSQIQFNDFLVINDSALLTMLSPYIVNGVCCES